ncbi:arylsulfatase [Massilibacteroides sp.]|uniref:arylsulfatase n=1 Tax=Massilibacteroides sp. TaxID=2034766 RepID=UPI0026153AE1|nr:arylsulfatase [Massilibacteroides sp.]MDD4516244.1 arylsulfatase [Massilibacteroides sp.]
MKNSFLISGVCLSLITSCSIRNKEVKSPNIIYILADDLGYGDLACYGQKFIKTPNLDRMAAEGMQFMQHYAGCTVSAPSRGSLMTGLHTGHSQIRGNKEIDPEGQQPLGKETFTLGKMLKGAGYATGIFGKWGLGYPESESTPLTMGFDRFYGYNCQRMAHSYYPDYLWDNDNKVLLDGNENRGCAIYSQQLIHEKALSFIRDNKDKPFFAMLTYTLPHAELNLPHDSVYQQYENSFEETFYDGTRGYFPVEKPRASFAAMVSRLDMYVGEVLSELKRLGIDDNTLVIFTSDNGPHEEGGADPDFFQSYGPLKGLKRDVYEGGIRVPFIARYPGKIKAGEKSDHISAFWDMMPTFAELVNTSIPQSVQTDGLSMLPTLLKKSGQRKHEYLYWEFHEIGGRIAVRKDNWKAVMLNARKGIEQPIELYDLSKDIHEDNNLADQYPERVEEMRNIMKNAHKESAVFPFYK